MVSYEIRTLKPVTAAELRDRVVEVLIDGFAHDTALLDMTGDDPALSPLVYRSWLEATLHSGKLDVAIVDGTIQGVALWFGPGNKMLGTREQAQLGWDEVFRKFGPDLVRWWKEEYPPQMSDCERLCGNVHESGWHLAFLAIASSQQRKGLGAALLRYGSERAAKDGVPAVLECEPKNTAFYERFGFKVMGTLHTKGPTKTWEACALLKDSVVERSP
ncbi:hypothetical protein AURDEDRAFT_181870 [Auricularia subglabra TFB-10046 SS5]|nr:hypothetical protein AURDEDRAFT_181870 [Auricularia subglabra TFB-10046 SS5]